MLLRAQLLREGTIPVPEWCELPEWYRLVVEVEETHCAACGRELRKKYTPERYPISFSLGKPELHHRRKECPKCRTVYASPEITRLLPRASNYAYEIIVAVGLARFRDGRRAEQIQQELAKDYRLHVPYQTILHLADRFLDGFTAVHNAASPVLREWMHRTSGGYIIHLDGTCEDGSSVIFLLVDAQTGFILRSGKMATENAADIEKLLRELVSHYGTPLATVRDLSQNIRSARDTVLPEVSDYVCEYHLLAVIGEKLLKTPHDRLKRLQQKHSIRASLTARRRDLVSRTRKDSSLSPEDYSSFLEDPSQGLRMSDTNFRRFFIHSLIQWIQDYHADLEGEYFPFDLAELAFCLRCQTMLGKVERWLATYPMSSVQRKTLKSLRKILLPVREAPALVATIDRLQKAWQTFRELRDLLRLKDEDGKPLRRDTANPEDSIAAAHRVDQDLRTHRETLRQRSENQTDPERAHDARVTKEKLDEQWEHLQSHVLHVPGRKKPLLVPRTNCLAEHRFGFRKRKWHSQSGNESLVRVLQSARPEQFLVDNLHLPEYVKLVYGGDLRNIPDRFAEVWTDTEAIRQNRKVKVSKRLHLPKGVIRRTDFLDRAEMALAQVAS